jgi:hypothetical protein
VNGIDSVTVSRVLLNQCTVKCMPKIVTRWETSGNGTGQAREESSKDYGSFIRSVAAIDGDNRAEFVNKDHGHKIHHLYLWHVSDKMGVLKHVLCVLSNDVACDGDIAHRSTQQVQQARRKPDDEEEKKEAKSFRVAVSASLSNLAISTKEEGLAREENKVERLSLALMEAEEAGDDSKVQFYSKLVDHHGARVAQYMEEIVAMKKQVKKLTRSPPRDAAGGNNKKRKRSSSSQSV